MAIVISGVNNNDKITATDGTIDLLSSANLTGILTAPAFNASGNITAASINAGVATATTFVGNLTGNVNATSNLLLQIGGSEKFRVGSSGQLGIGGANYGSSGQVLTSGGSGSAATWSTLSGTTINTNADNRIITGSGTPNTLNGEANLTYNGTKLTLTGNSDSPVVEFINTSGASGEGDVLKLRASGRGSGIDDTDIFLITNNSDTRTFGISNAGTVNVTGDIKMSSGKNINSSGIITATSFSGSGANLTGNITATAFIPTSGQLSHRNIIVNGAMLINQRGSSSTNDSYRTVDRFAAWNTSVDEAPTQSTFEVSPPSSPYHLPTSGAHPYKEGFRQAFGVTNGNQTSGAQGASRIFLTYSVEAKDLANSGWDYTSPSSFITLSFWVKSSVAGNFYGYLYNFDGTNLGYSYETGNLSQFTWTKVTKTIPGHASLQFDNNSEAGMWIVFGVYWGTNYTDAGNTLNQWAAWNSNSRTPVNATNWYTTNDASFQITGVQLEVGSVQTPFEHRSFGEELTRCYRYFQRDLSRRRFWGSGNVSNRRFPVVYPVEMRDTPSVSFTSTSIDSGSASANSITRQGYYFNMSGSGRYYEWSHELAAEI
tara:strand:- start:350 stop:2149 length:1800 start_codon:yes stop_codon:yes gene_type:complete